MIDNSLNVANKLKLPNYDLNSRTNLSIKKSANAGGAKVPSNNANISNGPGEI